MDSTQDMSARMTPSNTGVMQNRASFKKIASIVVAVLILVGAGAVAYAQKGKIMPAADASQGGDNGYKAVFLTNGQVYFGQIAQEDSNYVVLHKVFYLQVKQPLQGSDNKDAAATPPKPELNLVKLGTELHAPTDEMKVSRAQVLFTETLKDDSQVVKGANDYYAKNK